MVAEQIKDGLDGFVVSLESDAVPASMGNHGKDIYNNFYLIGERFDRKIRELEGENYNLWNLGTAESILNYVYDEMSEEVICFMESILSNCNSLDELKVLIEKLNIKFIAIQIKNVDLINYFYMRDSNFKVEFVTDKKINIHRKIKRLMITQIKKE